MLYHILDMTHSNNGLQPPKYQQILENIKNDILSGRYQPGQKLPSEAALLKRFGASRITVRRALRELQQAGLVQRRKGSGTYVGNASPDDGSLLFGLLMPNLGETEIFGPICQSMAEAAQAHKHALLWGHTTSSPEAKERQTLEVCQQYIAKKVAGILFAPLEGTRDSDRTNHRVVSALEEARIPIVLIDRCFLPYPKRSHYDLVSIDNRRAGYMVTEHLLKLGCQRIAFLAHAYSASTVEARIAGYREALFVAGSPFEATLVQRLNSNHASEVGRIIEMLKPDAVVCANDRTAGHVMQSLIGVNCRIPEDVRIVGIDDVEYASLLPVPLTTVHQPCLEIGAAAMAAMLERVTIPDMPVRDILLDFRLVIRDSCGVNLGVKPA